jgi:hypothetical protein
MRLSQLAIALVVLATPLAAQQRETRETRADRFMRNCDNTWSDRDRERFCEVRDVQVKVGTRLYVDGRDNGGVSFYGWDKNEILVRALVQANADSRADAQSLAKDIKILTENDRVRADGPTNRRYENWSVSYEIWVPRKMDLDAETQNGGIQVDGVEGRMTLRGVNGGIQLRDVAGDIRAATTNGGASAILSGASWRGVGLDLETTNGGVTLELPRNYNAELETGTVNGGLNIDFPITGSGFVSRRIRTKLGTGGPRIRAITTNGGVRIRSSN